MRVGQLFRVVRVCIAARDQILIQDPEPAPPVSLASPRNAPLRKQTFVHSRRRRYRRLPEHGPTTPTLARGSAWPDRPHAAVVFAPEVESRRMVQCSKRSSAGNGSQMTAVELGVQFTYTLPRPSPSDDTLYSIAYRLPLTVAPRVKGKRVAIVNDVINAGSAVRGTLRSGRETGSRRRPARSRRCHTTFPESRTASSLSGSRRCRIRSGSPRCPLCAQGILLDDGSP